MKTTLLKATAVALLLAACSSEENLTKTDNGTNTKANEGLAQLQRRANENLTQWFVVDAGQEHVSIKTRNGVFIDFNPYELKLNGHPVSGPVTIEYKEIFGVGNMVTANKTTMGLAEGSPDNPDEQELRRLFSGGEFYINMTNEEGQNLDDGTPITLTVPTELTENEGQDDEGMTVWEGEGEDTDGDGEANDEGDVTWDEEQDPDGSDTEVPVEDDKYILEILNFGWANIDKLDQIPGPRTTLSIKVPTMYNFSNSKCYLAYQAVSNSIAPMDQFDWANNEFEEHYGQVPIGLNCYVIFVAEQSGVWKYAIKPVTISPSGLVTITTSDIGTATEASLIAALDALP